MRILFVPFQARVLSHQIPLLALNKMLADTSIETAFLLPHRSQAIIRRIGARVLDIDHDGLLRTEITAYKLFRPDVVVDDTSFSTGFATSLTKLPRIAIQRTGMFPRDSPKVMGHSHSIDIDNKMFPDVTGLGLSQPHEISSFFNAPVKIVPGIRSIEQLPESIRHDPSYYFSGPLLIEDYIGEELSNSRIIGGDEFNLSRFSGHEPLKVFFDAHSHRKLIYLTLGLVAKPSASVYECINYLLSNGVAVISSIKVGNLSPKQQALYYHSTYLPMHYVCSNVDLVIHHCGSGTYHYPIIHSTPSITIGTKCYDRDNIAIRLQELGVSTYLPSPDECDQFVDLFKNSVERRLHGSADSMRGTIEKINVLRSEIELTSSSFDFTELLRKVTRHQSHEVN